MWLFTASADTAPSPPAAETPLVKKYLSSYSPRGQDRYLFDVTRLTVDSCIWIASATAFSVSGFRCSTPLRKKSSCWRTISLATLTMVFCRWSSAFTSQLALARQSASHALDRSEEHTSELQSLMRISYAVFCLKKKNNQDSISTI